MKHTWRTGVRVACLTAAAGLAAAREGLADSVFMNETTNVTVGAGLADTLVAQTGTGVVVKAGAGRLTLRDPGLFNGVVRLTEGEVAVESTGTAGAARPDGVFARAAFHVDASDAASLTLDGAGVAEWRDLRGGGLTATPAGMVPALAPEALNGLPVVDFGPMAFYTGEMRGMRWSRELTNSVKSVFWVLGSQFGGGFLLGASDTYHFHRGAVAGPPLPLGYMVPEAGIFSGYLPTDLWNGETQIDRQARNGRASGLSGAFHLVSLIATNTAATGATAGRFANDRYFDAQSGGQSLAEVAVFEEVLTPEERDAVEAYLTDKWFRGPDLRVVELAGTGSVARADGAAVRVNVLAGAGQLSATNAVLADTVRLAGTLDLTGGGAYVVGLLRGAGTLRSSAPVRLENVGLYAQNVTVEAEAEDGAIGTLYGQGALTLGGGVALDRVMVGNSIVVTNDGAGLAIGLLSGAGTLSAGACGVLTVGSVQVTNQTLTVNAGTNAVALGTLTGVGTLVVQTSGAVTIQDATAFDGTLYLDNCGPVTILGPAAETALRGLTVVGTASLNAAGGTLRIGRLYGRGTFTTTNVLAVTDLAMTANLTVQDGGSGPWALASITGPGTLTTTHPYYAPVIALSGSQVVTLGFSNRVERVSGTGTLNVPAGAFEIGALTLGGTLTFSNGGSPLTVAQAAGSGRLSAVGSGLTLGSVTLTNLQAFVADSGGASVTVANFNGHGAFRKAGAGDFTFPVPVTLRNLAVEGGTLHPVRESEPSIPAGVVPAFWVDASRADTVATNSQGGVTQWRDVRKAAPDDNYLYAYSEAEANAPGVLAASANGLPVVTFGPYQCGRYLRWSAQVNPVRAFFMAIGSHEGGGYLLGYTANNDFIRGTTGAGSYRTSLWNSEKFYTRFGRSYVDGERTAFDQTAPFNGGYQVLSFVDDTTETNNPTLQRGAADQFARYRTATPQYTSGQRLGEVLVCTNEVSEAERAAIEKYLTAKWVADIRRLEVLGETRVTLGEGETLSVDVACGAGRLAKGGAGSLKISNAALLAGGLAVEAGRLAFARTDRTPPLNPLFQVDASATDNSVMTNQYGYVTNWADVRFNGRSAGATNNAVNNAPNLLLNALNERPVVDFNYYGAGGTSLVTDRALFWNQEISTIRSAFWLLGSQLGGGFLLGHSAKYEFHRGSATAGDSYSPALFATSASAAVRGGRIYVDGLKLDSPDQTNVLNGGYQLVQLITTGNAYANQFSRDRLSATQCGGQRLGEVVLYDYELTEKERMNMEALLASKWFGDLRQVSLADGTELNTGAGTGSVAVATLAGSGTVRREGDAPLKVAEAAGFSGVLETRLDKLDVSRRASPASPAPDPSLWLDASRPGGVALNGASVTNIRDFSANNLPISFSGGYPELRTDELNGLPVIDLGRAVAGGKSLTFDGTRAPVLSLVAVHGSQEGGGCILGAASVYPFYREYANFGGTANPYTPIWQPSSSDLDVRQGWTYLDGQNICGVRRGYTGGYGLFSFVAKPRAAYTTPIYIAGDRGSPRLHGGLRFGELLLYSRVLTDAERQQTEAYLSAKWFGRASNGYAAPTLPVLGRVRSLGGALRVAEGRLAAIGEIAGANPVPVTGGGVLALTSGGATPVSYSVASGTLALSPSVELKAALPVTNGLAFWVDASKTDSLSFASGNATQVVQWADARGADYPYAYAYSDANQRYTNSGVAVESRVPLAITPPNLLPSALNGLPVLDFGAYNSTQWLLWSASVTGIRGVFWVVGSQNGGGHLMSGSNDINYFVRGTNYIANTPRVLWGANWTAITSGVSRIDGSPVNGLKTGLNGTGYQIVSLATTSAEPFAGAFASDRPGRNHSDGSHCGGQRLAEVLVYTRALSDSERTEVEAYLARKWFGRGTPGTAFAAVPHDGANVDVAAGGELILNGVARSSLTVTGNGYVADAGVPPTVYQLNGPRVFSQGLKLADGAKLFVDYDGGQPSSGLVTVSGGLTVAGSGQVVMTRAVNWPRGTQAIPLVAYDTILGGGLFNTRWDGHGAPYGYTLKPGWTPSESRLEATLSPSGTLLQIR